MPKRKSKRTICDIHDEIFEIALDIEAAIDDLIPLKRERKTLQKQIRLIMACSKEAKHSGQCMEDRLTQYKSGIESLGFKRKKLAS